MELFSTTSISPSLRFNLFSFELLYDFNTYRTAINSINNSQIVAIKSNAKFHEYPQLKRLYKVSTFAKDGSKTIKKQIRVTTAQKGYLISSHFDKCVILLIRELGTVLFSSLYMSC